MQRWARREPDAGAQPGWLVYSSGSSTRRSTRCLLDAEELSPVLRARPGELQNEVAELEREIAAETATLKGRTAVGEWRGQRYLLHIDIGALWMTSTAEEQRELLRRVQEDRGSPRQDDLPHTGLEFPVEIPWQKRSPGSPTKPSAVLTEVVGPGLEPGTP